MAKKTLSFLEAIEEQFGDFIVIDESEYKPPDVFSSGSLSLDISTGVGGIPRGRFTEIYGPESSGKTTLALCACKNAVNTGNKILYIDSEQTTDYKYIEALVGEFNKELFVLVQPETAEQSLLIAERGIDSGEFALIVLDSIGSLAPEKEKEKKLTDANVALLPNLMTRFSRRNAFSVRRNNIAFIGINQIRDKIGVYGSGVDTPGGHSWKHILSMKIQLSKSEDITKGTEKIGVESRFTIKKNKMAPPFRTFSFPIMFGTGIDYHRDAVTFAENLGIIQKKGSFYTFEDENLAQGFVKTVEYLRQNSEVLDKIKNKCYNMINSSIKEAFEDEEYD